MKVSEPSEWGKMKVLPLGIEIGRFSPPATPPNQSPLEILCVGRLVPDKGQAILLAAIDRLVRAKENILLRLVGDGPDRTELEREVSKRSLEKHVQFEGSVNQDQILDYYRKAGIFVLASFAEGVPVVLMEAMAMEIPCVSTPVAGIPELIENGKSGILVAPGDELALTDAIAQLLRDPGLRKKIGTGGRSRVIEKYDLTMNMRKKAAYFLEQLPKNY
jgi:glycosyltransferase involved in cell wall biosynthesis